MRRDLRHLVLVAEDADAPATATVREAFLAESDGRRVTHLRPDAFVSRYCWGPPAASPDPEDEPDALFVVDTGAVLARCEENAEILSVGLLYAQAAHPRCDVFPTGLEVIWAHAHNHGRPADLSASAVAVFRPWRTSPGRAGQWPSSAGREAAGLLPEAAEQVGSRWTMYLVDPDTGRVTADFSAVHASAAASASPEMSLGRVRACLRTRFA